MTRAARVLVTGGGRVARALARRPWPQGLTPIYRSRRELDLTTADLSRALDEIKADVVINTAAWTDVDGAESHRAAAWAANVEAAARLADATRRCGVFLLHLSTDYVFGHGEGPWREDSPSEPLGVYGESKRAGELEVLARDPGGLVVRTAWLFDGVSSNFLTTMMNLRGRATLDVVSDQRGSPTFTDDLADGLLALSAQTAGRRCGLLHFANAGEGATRFQVAHKIFQVALISGEEAPRLRPLSSRDWPSAALRPADSRLSIARWREWGLPVPRDWKSAVVAAVEQARFAGGGAQK